MATSRKKLVILSDGTWCGRETGTESNIAVIAKAVGISLNISTSDSKPQAYIDSNRNLKACYFAGTGLGGTFLEYLLNGATGNDIGDDCKEIYQYIVDNFDEQTDIWMFGLSRGSFTVRCVAGMINNTGIINKNLYSVEDTKLLVHEAYSIYRSPLAEDAPGTVRAKAFCEKVSWNVLSPIAVMAIIDTVGALGIPRLNAGVGFEWPEFYDQNVSSVVQKVYHARSIHDRLWIFEPCGASRSTDFKLKYEGDSQNTFLIKERWFPGCHYDLGRQKFKFFRDGVNIVEKFVFAIPNKLTQPVIPNLVCADLVLEWIYQCVSENDLADQIFINGGQFEIEGTQAQLRGNLEYGSGDVYAHIDRYTALGPFESLFGNWAVKTLNTITPNVQLGSAIQDFLGVKTILNVLFAVKDRRIPNSEADLVELYQKATIAGGQQSIFEKAGLQRYMSKTAITWNLIKRAVGNVREETGGGGGGANEM
jgi:hypothetical protein